MESLESISLAEQVQLLLQLVEQLQSRVLELEQGDAQLRQQVSGLRCDVGYWKSRHASAIQREVKLQAELDQAQAEIRQLKAERFGKHSEKQSISDRSNELLDPEAPVPPPKKKRGQQPGRPAPRRRNYSQLPVREDAVDLPDEAKVCACCGLQLESIGHGDDHEQIEIETTVYRRVIRRKRYRRTCECRTQGKVKWKHVMHLIRLLISGIDVLREGKVIVEVGEARERLLAIKRGEVSFAEADSWRKSLQVDFERAFQQTALPDRPDYERANEFLIHARKLATQKELP